MPDTKGTNECGEGYEAAEFCWPFDDANTMLGSITPEVIKKTKNAELKVSFKGMKFHIIAN